MKRTQANDKWLRRALLANALFSAASGLALILAPEAIAALLFAKAFSLFGLPSAMLAFALGLGLMVFAGFVAFTARQKMIGLGRVKLIVLADLLWAVDSALVLAVFPQYLLPIGFEGSSTFQVELPCWTCSGAGR